MDNHRHRTLEELFGPRKRPSRRQKIVDNLRQLVLNPKEQHGAESRRDKLRSVIRSGIYALVTAVAAMLPWPFTGWESLIELLPAPWGIVAFVVIAMMLAAGKKFQLEK